MGAITIDRLVAEAEGVWFGIPVVSASPESEVEMWVFDHDLRRVIAALSAHIRVICSDHIRSYFSLCKPQCDDDLCERFGHRYTLNLKAEWVVVTEDDRGYWEFTSVDKDTPGALAVTVVSI